MACDQLRGKTFYPRDWIFSKILRCLEGEQSGGGVTLMGGPGTGKTAVCCEVIWPTVQHGKQAQLSQRLLAYYFLPTSTHKDNFSVLLEFIIKIYDQITKSPLLSTIEYKNIDQVRLRQSPDDIFLACILKPFSNLSLESSVFILVDGLDDLRIIDKTEEFQSQSVSELLMKHRSSFPSWLKLVCTTRRHGKFFEGFRKIKLDDLRKSHVVRDVQQFILCRLDGEDKLKQQLDRRTAEMLNQLHIKSDGCLLYLERSLDLVAQGFVPLQEIRDIPGTLNGFYLWLCQKLFSRVRFELIRPLLSVIYASESSVKASELYDVVNSRYSDGMSRNDFNERLNTFRHIVLVERKPKNTAFVLDSYHRHVDNKDGVGEVLTLDVFHHSFREWSLDVKYCTRRFLCRLSEGHASLAIYLASKGSSLSPKMVEHLAWHLSRSDFRLESYQLCLAILYSGADLENCMLSPDATIDTSVLEILVNAGATLSKAAQQDVMVSSFTGGLINGNPLEFLSDDDEGDVSASSSSVPASHSRGPLACAAFQGNLQLVQLLVDAADSEMLEKTDPKTGQTPLMLAARYGHHEIVAVLVSAGAQLNRVDSDGWTALKSASWGGHVECVKHLVESGAEVNRCDTGGRTPLSAAAWCGHEEVVKLLIEFGGVVDWQDYEGRTSLMSAAYLGHHGIVQLLLSFGADPNLTDPDGRTALFVACSGVGKSTSERVRIVESLLEAGADVTLVDVDGLSVLTVAACEGRSELCELLLESDADVDWEDMEGRTAIDWAVMMGHAEVVKTLLFWGACVDAIDPDGRTLLGNAAQQGNSEVVRLLLDRGLDEMHRDNYGWTSLHVAVFEGQTEVVQVLLEAGTHADEQDNEGRTPLFLAAQEGHVTILSLLSESSSTSADCKTHDLRTPLMVAGALNREASFRVLLFELNADPRRRDAFGRNVLHWIALENCGSDVEAYKLVKLVLDEYPEFDLDVADDEGQTALHCCSWLGRTTLCELLLSRGANPDPLDLESRTPLILAAWQDQSETVEALLKYGAKVNHRARDGATALAVAFQERHECVIKVLLNHSRIAERQRSMKDRWGSKAIDSDDVREKILISGEHRSKEAESSLVRYSKPCKLPGQKKIIRNASGVASDREADAPGGSKLSGLSRGSSVAERAFSDGSNPRMAAGDTPTTTTTTSGVSSMEMTFSNSLAACGPVVSGSGALGKSGNLLSASDQDVDAPNNKSAASRSERSSSSCGAGRGPEVESSGSSGDMAVPAKKEQTTQTSNMQQLARGTALGDSSGSGIDFARELDRLSNPRNRSFRGAGYSSNYLGASSGTAHSTSDSNISLASDKRNVTRRPNKKKREQVSGDSSNGKSFDVCCVSRKPNKKQTSSKNKDKTSGNRS